MFLVEKNKFQTALLSEKSERKTLFEVEKLSFVFAGRMSDTSRMYFFQAVNSSDKLWVNAKAVQYPVLIGTALELLFSVLRLGRADWTVYSTLVFNYVGTVTFYTATIAILPIA